jgi:hypothetical protein
MPALLAEHRTDREAVVRALGRIGIVSSFVTAGFLDYILGCAVTGPRRVVNIIGSCDDPPSNCAKQCPRTIA